MTLSSLVIGPVLEAATPVRTAQARAGRQQVEISLSGSVVASRRARVACEVAGIVDRFDVRVGDRVRAGDPLAQLRATPIRLRIEAARAELAEAQARHRSSELRLERLQELSGSEVVSRQSVDDSLFDMQAAAARVERLKAELSILEDRLERSTIRAPFDGAVVEEHTQRGEWLNAGDTVIELVSLGDQEIRLDLPENHRRLVRAGAKALIRLETLDGRKLEGEVRALVPSASESARTFPVFVRLLEPVDLGVGATVKATLLLGDERGAVWVPRDALVRRGGQDLVFRLDGDSAVRSVEVEQSAERGEWLTVQGEVSAGDDLVVEGNENLHDGDLVSVEPKEYVWP